MSVFKQTPRQASEGSARPIPTAGSHLAVLVAMVDLGTHKEKDRKTGKLYDSRKVYLCWEVEDEDAEGGPRFLVGDEFTMSLLPTSRLRKLIKAWRGKDLEDGREVDLDKMLGSLWRLTINHKDLANGRTVATIDGASKPASKDQPIKPTHQPVLYEINPELSPELPDWLPYTYGKSLADKIGQCNEMRNGGADAGEVPDAAAVGSDPF